MSSQERLQAKVRAVNAANKVAMELYDKLAPIFAVFVGKKVLKADGTLLAKVRQIMPALLNTGTCSVRKQIYSSEIRYIVRISERILDQESCLDYEGSVFFGNVKDGILQNLAEKPLLPTGWHAEDVIRIRKTVERLETSLNREKLQIADFGMYD